VRAEVEAEDFSGKGVETKAFVLVVDKDASKIVLE